MPKNKTNSGAKKRFRVTGSGKIMHKRAHQTHKFEERSRSSVRRLSNDAEVSSADRKSIKKLLGK
ncbi:ribosomal protein L35 [Beutenbergia cavernae DSM 12333]|uniref:Large ribosomal subunit protein bL35 n=1 Tax=Beutenbergia cavernae (strain ATCC BAA-8 / DSM 12333 / CCUG 43141 / JCM 11478 / NBRC 16432 / NCIMB 13614 / HKI 0122) TaxID=471853 RepID=RL35_BEUC1|nr:50S ribosomal protein L35 [Beutenbergia cavernae]C5BW33.1 RecName: Full=Large ribosomal subunit protein bL35; AltName: Full=50S ribosomal protein L35 [Beutenbergia cavernae DSM 12333]ACQ80634.1 ribosomal protein L35 [Beutenbergia cavernae DSM 12333]